MTYDNANKSDSSCMIMLSPNSATHENRAIP